MKTFTATFDIETAIGWELYKSNLTDKLIEQAAGHFDCPGEIIDSAYTGEIEVKDKQFVVTLTEGDNVKNRVRRMKFLFRHYRSGDWCPYQGVIRSADDAREAGVRLIDELTDHLRDGDEFELVVRRTGRKVTTRHELKAPHRYGKTKKPKSKGCPECQKMEAEATP